MCRFVGSDATDIQLDELAQFRSFDAAAGGVVELQGHPLIIPNCATVYGMNHPPRDKTEPPVPDLWFKRRRYGWGWAPVAWQGFVLVGTFVIFNTFFALAALPHDDADVTAAQITTFLVGIAISTTVLAIIASTKGPKPKWRWGKKPGDNPREDF